MEHTFEGNIIVTEDNIKIGLYVQRGRDWKWDEQDWFNGKPSVGKIIRKKHFSLGCFWVGVKWESGRENNYRVSNDQFDLVFSKKIINFL